MLVTLLGLALLTGSVIHAVDNGKLITEFRTIAALPWGMVTFIDIYVGFTLFSLWIFWRESHVSTALVWTILVFMLGNIVSCIYLFIALYQSASLNSNAGNGRFAP